MHDLGFRAMVIPTPTRPLASDPAAIAELADRIIAGEAATADELNGLFAVEPGSSGAEALFAGAQRIRAHFVGMRLKACSVINVKAGNCSENCSYCAQAAGSENDGYQKSKWLPEADIQRAAETSAANGAQAVSLVAAWWGVKEGTQLDMVTKSIRQFAQNGKVRPDVNLGILETQKCADEIAKAGAKVYGHNLETAASHFDSICSSHSWEERMKTIQYIKKAGMGLCSGGIFGMGESKAQRVEFLQQVAYIAPDMVPLNFLNPLPGTKLAHLTPLDADEALTTLAVARFALPDRNLMVAGGKEIVLGDRVGEVFKTGINCVMVGNYLTTGGADPAFWGREAAKYGLEMPQGCIEIVG
ncbi:MAG TPA: biotin synthase BioB [Planctomycetes bacterium]|nr:biotin synthase BioB [Planctomycetota bacterium]